jgi:hypothetical protein
MREGGSRVGGILFMATTRVIWLGAILFCAVTAHTNAQTTNAWIFASGKWEIGDNWSLGVPPSSAQSGIFVTNSFFLVDFLTISIDSTTVLSNAINECMTINNLKVAAPRGRNTLALTDAGLITPLRVLGSLTLSNRGAVTVTNSVLVVSGIVSNDGVIVLNSGSIIATNAATLIGNTAAGLLTVTGGTFVASNVTVAAAANSQGTLTIAGGSNTVLRGLLVGGNSTATGSVWLTGGQLTVPNNTTDVGSGGAGQMTVSNGTWRAGGINVGNFAGSQGTLTLAGGTNFSSGMSIGLHVGATGAVWMTGLSQFNLTNGGIDIGGAGVAQLTVSNGTLQTRTLIIPDGANAQGTLTMAGGDMTVGDILMTGANNATSVISLRGGQLIATNSVAVGQVGGLAQVTVNSGTFATRALTLGVGSSERGTLMVAGGTSSVYSNLTLGNFACSGTGIVTVAGGRLFVTNATHNAVLDVRTGMLTMNSGFIQADKIILTNVCAHFIRTGGTLIYSNAVLSSTRDDDGDGIPNGYEQSHGLDPLNPINATLDSDGDGLTDLQESLAGTDPTNSASAFRITAITREGNNIRVTWMTGTAKTNALERTAGAGGSFATNDFAAVFTVTNTSGTVTNYLDMGAATAVPAFYYRVRLVP